MKNLKVQWKSFLLFCIYFGKTPFPASTQTMALYAQFLARSFKSVNSIQNYLSGVRMLHVLLELQPPELNAIEIRLAIRGMTKIKSHKPKQAFPITPELLLKIHSTLDLAYKVDLTFWALALIAFFTMARKSNLVPDSIHKFDPSKQLMRRDIIADDECLLISYKWSKTNQAGSRVLRVPILAIPGSILCPVKAYKAMVQAVPGLQDQPAFLISWQGGLVPFTYPMLQDMLKRSLQKLGQGPENYSSHSFRRGGASFAFRAGVSPNLIQLQGDWVSDAYKLYLSFDIRDRASVSLQMGLLAREVENSGGNSK